MFSTITAVFFMIDVVLNLLTVRGAAPGAQRLAAAGRRLQPVRLPAACAATAHLHTRWCRPPQGVFEEVDGELKVDYNMWRIA